MTDRVAAGWNFRFSLTFLVWPMASTVRLCGLSALGSSHTHTMKHQHSFTFCCFYLTGSPHVGFPPHSHTESQDLSGILQRATSFKRTGESFCVLNMLHFHHTLIYMSTESLKKTHCVFSLLLSHPYCMSQSSAHSNMRKTLPQKEDFTIVHQWSSKKESAQYQYMSNQISKFITYYR